MSFLQIPIGTYPNTFLGYESSIEITTGIDNTAFGFNTLERLRTGSANSAFGHKALGNLTTGTNNTAIGYLSQEDTLTGTLNVSVGARSLLNNISGNANVAIGEFALSQTQIANQNVAIGYESGKFMTTGSKNSILGSFTGAHPLLDIRTLSNYVVLSNGDGDPLLWITPTGTVNIPGGLALTGSLSITGGTVTANNPVLSATQTWNNAAVTFTGWQLNVTDTASNVASSLIDLQRNGVSFFYVTKFANGTLNINSNNTVTIGDGYIRTRVSASNGFDLAFNGLSLGEQTPLIFRQVANGTTYSSLFSTASGTIEQRNGVNAQTLRVYNTFTDASNYERGKIEWASNVLRIGTEKAGTGTARALDFQTDGTSRWSIAATSNNLTSDMGGAGIVGFESGSVYCASGSVFKSRGIAYLDSTTGDVRLRPGGVTALLATSSGIAVTGFTEMTEQTAPAAPAANSVRIYAEDNGSGKTRLMALFATGAAQQIAIEP